MKKPKPHNSGQWTDARKRSFVMSALRGAKWPVKYEAIKNAYVKDGVNPATGRKCKLHKCAQCGNLFPQKDMAADHVNPGRCGTPQRHPRHHTTGHTHTANYLLPNTMKDSTALVSVKAYVPTLK